jgi:hypothetical protein
MQLYAIEISEEKHCLRNLHNLHNLFYRAYKIRRAGKGNNAKGVLTLAWHTRGQTYLLYKG